MRITRKHTIAAAAAGTVIALIGSSGIAMAAGQPAPANTAGTIAVPAAASPGTPSSGNESAAEGIDDGTNQGPDANPNEPGHQDASSTGDAAEGPEPGAERAESATDDGTDKGPDANPNEPGHQDAGSAGDAADTQSDN